MFINFKRGFTLIELLVVLAIIGLLSSIIMAVLRDGRSRAADASVKSNLVTIRTQSAVVYDSDGSYSNLFVSGSVADNAYNQAVISSGHSGTAGFRGVSPDGRDWYAIVRLTRPIGSPTRAWCVDSEGSSRLVNWIESPVALPPCPAAI